MSQPAVKEKENQLTATEALQALLANEQTKNLPELRPIQDAIKSNIISLGTDEAFALRDAEGEIRAFRQRLTLSTDAGTLVQPVPGGPYVVSAQGYEVWAEAAGANVIFPDQVLVGAKWQPNPHAVMGDQGRIKVVHARAVAFRFSSKGIPQVADWSTVFDCATYRTIDLLAKANKTPQAFRLLPNGVEPKEEEGTWGKYVFDECMNLWINSAHQEALKWYSQILNREKKAMDFGQTFARRNALKHLSGLQKAPGPVWTISVTCWRPTSGNIVKWDATQYIALQKRVGNLVHAQDEFKAKQIEAQSGKDFIEDEESGYTILETELDPEDQQAEAQIAGADHTTSEGKKSTKDYTAEEHQALQSLAVIESDPEFNPIYKQACQELKVNPAVGHDPETAKKLLEIIGRLGSER